MISIIYYPSLFLQYFDCILMNTFPFPDRYQRMPIGPWLWKRPWQHFEPPHSCVHVNTSLLIVILTPRPLWRPAGVPVSAASPFSQSSLRMWAGVWHWQSAAHSCSHSTKTSMWHLTAMPDERRTPPQAVAALPFKMRPTGPCPERWHLGLRHRGSLRLFFPPTCGLLSVLGCYFPSHFLLWAGGQARVVCY